MHYVRRQSYLSNIKRYLGHIDHLLCRYLYNEIFISVFPLMKSMREQPILNNLQPMNSVTEYNFLSKWLSFIILRVSSDDIKVLFRKLERLTMQLIKDTSHRKFNETYSYTYIYIPIIAKKIQFSSATYSN